MIDYFKNGTYVPLTPTILKFTLLSLLTFLYGIVKIDVYSAVNVDFDDAVR
jgi:hypothetical protein